MTHRANNSPYNCVNKSSGEGFLSNKKKRYTIITILIMAFIFFQSALPADLSAGESGWISAFLADLLNLDVETMSFIVRKCAHFTEYMILGVSLFLTVREYLTSPGSTIPYKKSSRTIPWIAWGIGSFYALTDEIHQIFSAGRSCEFRDMCIDSAGVLTGILLVRFIQKGRQKKDSSDG